MAKKKGGPSSKNVNKGIALESLINKYGMLGEGPNHFGQDVRAKEQEEIQKGAPSPHVQRFVKTVKQQVSHKMQKKYGKGGSQGLSRIPTGS
eukprot:1285761-Amorphochlora_amoeboformis.AAC.2